MTLNAVGNVTTLRNVSLSYNPRGQVLKLSKPATNPTDTEAYAYDSAGRRIARIRQGSTPLTQFFVNEGANLAAIMDGAAHIQESWLYEGVDAPLRINVRGAPNQLYYYEVDLTGNVRRMFRTNGTDAGGYRYTAFGTQMAADAKTPAAQIDQPLRWKGRFLTDFVSGAGLYDVRARMWSPEMGSFTSIDECAFHDRRSTLWGWPRQNPIRFLDPSGHEAHVPTGLGWLLYLDDIGFLQQEGDYIAGATDVLTFGATDLILDATGLGKFGNKCSDARRAGEGVGLLVSLLDGESEGQLVKDFERLATDNRGAIRIGPKAALKELPILDRTGKGHGDLPRPEDFGRYSPEDLAQLRDELRESVQERIEKTSTLGSDPGHSERQAGEQRLLQQLEKYLRDL